MPIFEKILMDNILLTL